ncbi:MAG TPA: Flp pilus assembly protein CpaB [Caulobacteraceae bacterium]|jgi:pilus assembly protein CpaB|nr:Flp pilus assembly protein CpaB [Caulobacteraceae bacterium]
MPLRTIATFAIAIVLGLVAVVLINVYMGSSRKAQTTQVAAGAGSPVVVAAAPITRGAVVQPAQLKIVNYPAGAVPTGSFTAIAQVTGGKDVQRVALRDLGPDEPVLATRVSAPGGKLNLASELDPGTQAISIRTSDVAGVGGFVLPNDRVDILLSRQVGKETPITQVVAENVRVLGVDQVDDQEANKPIVVKTATIEVTPQQSQSITLAQTMGTLSMALRHVQDSEPVGRLVTTAAAFGFYGGPRPAISRAVMRRAGPSPPTVRVTRSTDTSVYQLSAR